ncbi:hypothetical protein N7509_002904 [Penicillium cosmopolitanum]|uniref:Amino acid permease/ SLC12A domain-containing protein n=1 Tax=Penicillium cosmopolitanum TaxID=1131564 RepID=A0A9X0BDV7_9EURO|nr:uncharacterized protein N7509_002904 [Penicillium cosmopolitanum]KAJ5409021.1 hypothetical protein N7509_002904 [Penicillium cosmopolitanum]
MEASGKTTALETMDMEVNRRDPQISQDGGTAGDDDEMTRMGKVQEFKRNMRPLAALSFASVLQATWEYLILSNYTGLEDGGLAGLFWSYIWTFIGFGFIIASLAEMASMAPTDGGQYHWVSEFCSPRHQKFLSYVTGWMSVLAWQAGTASGSFLTGTLIQGLITVRNPDYTAPGWQGTLLVFSMVLVIYFFNVYASELMPLMSNLLMFFHILSWAVILIMLWATASHRSAEAVFVTDWKNIGGLPTMGVSVMVGQISAIYGCLSSDACAHMSEEIKDAGRNVPVAMYWGYFSNGIMAAILLVAYLFATPSVEDSLDDASGFPLLYVFKQMTSTAGVNGLTAIIILPVIFSNIMFNASTSRQTWAFARDKGLPFSKWISKIDPKRMIPVNAIILSCVISCLLSLINIGSSTAFNAIISLNTAALMFTYQFSISCVIYRKIWYPKTLPARRWDLGRFGLPINIIGVLYCFFAMFWSFWPTELPITAENFNWSVVIFVAIFILSLVMYVLKGRKEYEGPVVEVKQG